MAVGPIIEHVAAMIASGAGLSKQPTLLTQRSRSAGRGRRKAPKPPTTSRHIEAHGDEAVRVRADTVGKISRSLCDPALLLKTGQELLRAPDRRRST